MEEENNIPEATPQEVPTDESLVQATTEIPTVWGVIGVQANNAKQLANIRRSRGIVGTTHGMYASVPMICKGLQCPFRETCWIPDGDLVVGERCPIEIATIMEQYDNYCTQLAIGPDDKVDQGLTKQLIDVEIAMMRADSKMASSPDLVREVVDAINQRTGDVYHKSDIDPIVTLKSDLRKEHHRILNQLQATRKDKKDQLIGLQDPSSMAAKLIQRVRTMEAQQGKIVDAEIIPPTQEEVTEDAGSSTGNSVEHGIIVEQTVQQGDEGAQD